jgi:hypothetical protein
MGFLPGWDSADTTAAIAHNLHITAIVVLGLLVLSEALALVYDSRKEHLTGVAISIAEVKRKSDADAAEARRKTETEALQQRLSEADKKVTEAQQSAIAASKKASEVEKKTTGRHLTEQQRKAIFDIIAPDAPKTVKVMVPVGDSEAHDFALEFMELLRTAGWDPGSEIIQAIYSGDANFGIQVYLNKTDALVGIFPAGTVSLIKGLEAAHLTDRGYRNDTVRSGELELRVNTKPRT